MAHAAFDFTIAFPALTSGWHASSNTLVVLAVRDELALSWLGQDAEAAGLAIVKVHEPDLGGALTAIAVESAGWRLLRGVPMAFASDSSPDLWWEEVNKHDLRHSAGQRARGTRRGDGGA